MKFAIILLFYFGIIFSQTINQQIPSQLYSVTLNGGNFNSGVYLVPPSYRILDVLKIATDTLKLENISRDIRVDGTNIDIFQYLFKNDQNQNPPIKAGMQIFVTFPERYIIINGDVQNKINKIAIKKDETLQSLLSLFTLNPSADSSFVRFIRNQESSEISRKIYSTKLLENNDFIIIPTLKSKKMPYLIQIRGEIEKPGFYPIQHGTTTVKEILSVVNLLQSSDTSKICIYRKIKLDQLQSPRQEVSSGLKNLSSQFITICSNSSQILNDSDIIEISKFDSNVYVNGYVVKPSAIRFDKNLSIKDYIEKVGGFTKAADKVNIRILTSCGINYQIRDVKEVQPGDIILVPESSESKWVKTWSPIIGVIGSTASIIAALINISK